MKFELNKVYNMDCLEAMKEMPDKHFELAIVDPPYGINAPNMQMGSSPKRKGDGYPAVSVAERLKKGRLNQGGGGKLKNRNLQKMPIGWDYEVPSDEYFKELARVSKNQIIWGGNYFDLPPSRGVVCWDKMQPWDNFSQWEMAWTSFDVPAKIYRLSNTGGANRETKIHPTQKPIALYKWLLDVFAKPGDKILDTHLGSGSSRIAAHLMGFDFVGFELDLGYFTQSERRYQQHIRQQVLFPPNKSIAA